MSIPRPRVAARIRAAAEAGAVVLVAGAGYGKTVAVEEALADASAAWVSCRASGADPGGLLLAALEAVRAEAPGTADVLLERLGNGVPPDVLATTRTLLRELDVLLVEPIFFVLDDAEQLGAASLPLVGQLLEAETARLRIVLCARRPLGLRLARLETTGRLTTLGERDLAFDAVECAELLEARSGREPTEGEVEAALRATLGWPLGLALGASGVAEPDGVVGRFLAEEVLEPLDPETRATALASSAVEIITPGVAAALALPDDLADRLGRAGLLLRPVPKQPDAVAYHPLLGDLLRERWRAEVADAERARLLAAAAAALLADGRLAEAIDAWLEAGQPEPALAALIANAETLVRLSPDTAERWLERLPAAARVDPRALALRGQLAAFRGRHGAAVKPLRSAIAALAEPRERAALEATLVDSLYWLGRLEEAREVVAHAAVRTPLIEFWEVYLLATVGRIDQAEALLPAASHVSTAGRLDVAFFLVAMPDGRHEQAIARLQERYRALPKEERTGHWPQHVASFTAFALADAGRPEEALEWIERAHEEMTRAGLADAIEPLVHIHRGWTLVLAGREAEAEVALGAMQGGEPPEGWTPVVLLASLAACAAARADHAQARTLADQALVLSVSAPVQFRAMVGWVLVPVTAEASGLEAALALLDAIDAWLDERLPPPHGEYFRLRAAALRAWTHLRGGDPAAAAVAVGRLVQHPAPAIVELVIRAEWRRVEPVLRAGVAEGLLPPERALALLAGGSEAGIELERTVREAAASVRGAAARVIGRSGHPRAGALLRDLARDTDLEVAAAAEAALAAGVAAPPPRTFRLFGGFVFGRGRWTADDTAWRRPTSARLVRALLLRRGSLVPEDELLEVLWPGSGSKAARTSLQVAASRARTVLDVPDAPVSAIQNQDRAYRIVLDPRDRVDTELFALAAREALAASGPERTGRLERAAGLWTAEPLPEERYADWTRDWREGLETTYGRVMRALAEARAREADHAGAAAAAGFLVERDPLDEGMQRLLIASHARAGNRSRALRQYLACRRSLVDALGIEPAAETQELQRRVLAGAAV